MIAVAGVTFRYPGSEKRKRSMRIRLRNAGTAAIARYSMQ